MASISASPQVLVGGRAFPARPDRPRPVQGPVPASTGPVSGAVPRIRPGTWALVALLALGAGLGALAGAHALPVLAPAGAGAPVVSAEGVAHRAWTVQPGDTLWVIAEQVRPEADPRATVLVLRSINGLGPQYSLQPGQVLLLPAA